MTDTVPQDSNFIEVYAEMPVSSLRDTAITRIRNSLRPGQQQMADWRSGPLAISAVPGAGKSTGIAAAGLPLQLHVSTNVLRNYAKNRAVN